MKKTLLLINMLCLTSPLVLADNTLSPSPSDAKVSIVQPADQAVVPANFNVKFALSGMEIVPAGTQKPNSGHYHLLLDLETMPDMTKALPANEHILHFGKGQTETNLTLTPGKHTLQLVLGDYAHVPHNKPVVSEKITVIVK